MISIPEVSNQHETLEWRLYRNMLVTRLFEDALVRWEQEGKISAQTFPSKGQEAISIGCCAALEHGDTVIPSFRTRGAMIGMGVSVAEQLREFLHSPLAAGDSRDAPHHSSWPDRGVMPGSTMIGGHLSLAAGLALVMQFDKQKCRERGILRRWHFGVRGSLRNHAHRRRVAAPFDFGLRKQWVGNGDGFFAGAADARAYSLCGTVRLGDAKHRRQ